MCVVIKGEHSLDDEGSAERQIQSVFDFLEEAEDLDRGCEYWGANPRHSLNVDDEEEVGNIEERKGESSDEDVILHDVFIVVDVVEVLSWQHQSSLKIVAGKQRKLLGSIHLLKRLNVL